MVQFAAQFDQLLGLLVELLRALLATSQVAEERKLFQLLQEFALLLEPVELVALLDDGRLELLFVRPFGRLVCLFDRQTSGREFVLVLLKCKATLLRPSRQLTWWSSSAQVSLSWPANWRNLASWRLSQGDATRRL